MQIPIPEPIKYARKLSKLPLAKVIRRLKQSARRASTAHHLLPKLSPTSPFRRGLVLARKLETGHAEQARAEIQRRHDIATGRAK